MYKLVKLAAENAFSGEPTPVREIKLPLLQGLVAETALGMERAALDRWGKGDINGSLENTADDYTYFDPYLNKRIDELMALRQYPESLRQ